eukprot:Phypoly_transcript_07216.p1 GENE.Phypoly_transcript_07216~~Phypoly_transcript_07216.p1  ORF type:complete len:425 (+),score=72.80 Phypoly_transcript_07216:125-1399(+)
MIANDPFYDLFAHYSDDESCPHSEFRAVLDLLHVAEQVINSLPPDLRAKYTFIKKLVSKNIEKERENTRPVQLYKKPVVETSYQSPPKVQHDLQVTKLMEMQSKISNLKSAIDDFHSYINTMYTTLGDSSDPQKTATSPSSPLFVQSSSFGLDSLQQNTTSILSLLQQTHTSFTNLQQTTRVKLYNAHTLSHTLTATQSKLSSTEKELESLKVETDAKMSKHALDLKQINREHTRQMHNLQNELLTAKTNVLRSLNSSSKHERDLSALTTAYELKLAEKDTKIADLGAKAHELDAIAQALGVSPPSDVTPKVLSQIKAIQDTQKYAQELATERSNLRAQLDALKDSNREEIMKLRNSFLDVQSRAQITLQTLDAERRAYASDKEKMRQKISELLACARKSEGQYLTLGSASAQLNKILLDHANT